MRSPPAVLLTLVICVGLLASVSALAAPTAATPRPAPAVTATTIDGRPYSLSALRGKVVVVNFQVPGCGACEVQAPALNRLAKRYGRGFVATIVDFSALSGEILRIYYGYRVSLKTVRVVDDRSKRMKRAFGARFAGETYVIGRDGRIVWQGFWLGKEARFRAAVERALAGRG